MTARSGALDAARGVGILLVVGAHALIPPIREHSAPLLSAWSVVYAFHMSLFFVIAGQCFELSGAARPGRSFGQYTRARARKLLLPYLIYSLLVYLALFCGRLVPRVGALLTASGYPAGTVWDALRDVLLVRDNAGSHLWFLPRMFLVSCLSRLLGRHAARWYGLAAAFALSCLPEWGYLGWFLRTLGAYMLYFNVGRRFSPAFSSAPAPASASVPSAPSYGRDALSAALHAAVFSALWFLRAPAVNAISDALGYAHALTLATNGAFAALQALAGSGAVLSLGRLAAGCTALTRLGQNAFPVYLLHQPFLTTGVAAALLLFVGAPVAVCVVAAFTVGLAVPLLLDRFVLKRSRVLSYLLLGEKNNGAS